MTPNMSWKVFSKRYPDIAAHICSTYPEIPTDPNYVFRVRHGMVEFGYPSDTWLLR